VFVCLCIRESARAHTHEQVCLSVCLSGFAFVSASFSFCSCAPVFLCFCASVLLVSCVILCPCVSVVMCFCVPVFLCFCQCACLFVR